MSTRAWAEVDLAAVAANVGELRRIVGGAEVWAVVKADGYGHGAGPVAAAALDAGAAGLAVAIVTEGVELREFGVDAPVLVLSEPRLDELGECVTWQLQPTCYTTSGIDALAASVARMGFSEVVAVHLKLDTGMHRVGADPAAAVDLAGRIDGADGLALASVWTHCAVADDPDDPFTATQLARFDEACAALTAAGVTPPRRHAANSAGALCHPAARLDLVRAGIAVYGIAPAPGITGDATLRPALSLRAGLSLVKVVSDGERLSYGLRHRVEGDRVIATVSVGYADGIPRRSAAVGAEVLVGARRRPIVGAVTMDQLLVDCGPATGRGDADGPVPAQGDEVVLIGAQGGARITAEDWATRLDTIAYEVVCGIGPRVPRHYLGLPDAHEDGHNAGEPVV